MLDKNTKDLWDHANTFDQIKFSHLSDDINLLLSSVGFFFLILLSRDLFTRQKKIKDQDKCLIWDYFDNYWSLMEEMGHFPESRDEFQLFKDDISRAA